MFTQRGTDHVIVSCDSDVTAPGMWTQFLRPFPNGISQLKKWSRNVTTPIVFAKLELSVEITKYRILSL